MEETQTQSPEDQELAFAMKALADAKERKARAEKMALDKAAADLAANRAAEEKRLADARAEAEAIQKHWAEKSAKEAADRAAVEAQRKAEEDRLIRELSKREEVKRLADKKAAEIKEVQDAAHQMEIDAANIEASLRVASTPREEEKPMTLQDARHPLSRIFGNGAEVSAQPQGLDSVEQAQLQLQKDKAVEPTAWIVKKRGPGNNFVNSSSSFLLEKEIKKSTGIQANTQRLDLLSSQYDEESLMKALSIAVAEFLERPMSHDGLLHRLESLLLEAENGTA